MTTLTTHEPRFYLERQMDAPELMEDPSGHLVVYSCVCPGKTEPNDDSAAIIPVPGGRVVLAVADGIGGSPFGYKASAITLQCLAESLATAGHHDDLRPAILDAIESANIEIQDLGTGSATTLSVVEIQNRVARGYQVGDSMSLIVGGRGTIKWKSTSHSPVGYMLEAGAIDEQEAMTHDDRHFVSNIVGSCEMHIEVGPAIKLAPRDSILVATDGLLDNVYLAELCDLSRAGKPLDRMNAMLSLATKRMTGDHSDGFGKPDDLAAVLLTP